MAGYCHETADISRLATSPLVEVLVYHGYNRVCGCWAWQKLHAITFTYMIPGQTWLSRALNTHAHSLPLSPRLSPYPPPSYPFPPVSPSRYEPCISYTRRYINLYNIYFYKFTLVILTLSYSYKVKRLNKYIVDTIIKVVTVLIVFK
ncbi:uncharacterized protein LY79DRAFT_582220 [Colletotrichum navitas]|uniref:Uncharacterized protein n=1 Tax=Colletotrichum navitas TaxID=681940 RepID=A0AAD8V2S1_9PEZI|nr:uncharacterized protein LY79DRAFT_582220 [Colletotrichum navitas]KAK1579998.1 hypothetical protein LY79DRAFT_582220 [Colletotrichum navitas]